VKYKEWMRRIYAICLVVILAGAVLITVSCQKAVNEEPIRIYIEPDLPKAGLEIWQKDIEYVGLNDNPDLVIKKTNELPKNDYARETHYYKIYKLFGCKWLVIKRPAFIHVRVVKPVIIAHEFGHFLLKKHSPDTNSIMNTNWNNMYKDFDYFLEFK
jgi:hypothetical protein